MNQTIVSAKMNLYKNHPFFSYLVSSLKIQEKERKDVPTACVDAFGNMYYSNSFFSSLNMKEAVSVLLHEALHVAFCHCLRLNGRDPELWNIAVDIVVNNMLINNEFTLPKDCLTPNNNTITLNINNKPVVIQNINAKMPEPIYEELLQHITKNPPKNGQGQSLQDVRGGFDSHEFNKNMSDNDNSGGENKGLSPSEIEEQSSKWERVLNEAAIYAKSKGNVPIGMERIFDFINQKHKICWKKVLRHKIVDQLPFDFNWMKRSKSSFVTNCYTPAAVGEKVRVNVAIDTSGSMSNKQLKEIVTELCGIANDFKNAADVRILVHDCSIHNDVRINNITKRKILTTKYPGGGGTSHVPVFETLVRTKKPYDTKSVILFTDGYSDLQNLTQYIKRFNIFIFLINSDKTTKNNLSSLGYQVMSID